MQVARGPDIASNLVWYKFSVRKYVQSHARNYSFVNIQNHLVGNLQFTVPPKLSLRLFITQVSLVTYLPLAFCFSIAFLTNFLFFNWSFCIIAFIWDSAGPKLSHFSFFTRSLVLTSLDSLSLILYFKWVKFSSIVPKNLCDYADWDTVPKPRDKSV